MLLKKLPLFTISLVLNLSCLSAQSDTIPVSAVIHANNIRATVWSNGLLFSDGGTGAFFPEFNEQEPGIAPIQAAGLWISHVDPGGAYYTDITRKIGGGSDFMPGQLEREGFIYSHRDFNRIWKVTKAEIIAHVQDYQDNQVIDDPIPAIFSWPAWGNQFFEAYNNGMELPESQPHLARYWDLQAINPEYNPDKGDFPLPIVGLSEFGLPSEILWFSFHGTHTFGEGQGVSPILINCCVYAYECSEEEILSNTIFVDYQIINKGPEQYCVNTGMWADVSMGCPDDDYMGTVPEDWMAYAYNSDNVDDDCGDQGSYGENPPALGMRWVKPFFCTLCDECDFVEPYKHTATAIYENGDAPPGQTYPENEPEVFRYLNGHWRDGSYLNFGESGYQVPGNDITTHIFPGDVTDPASWTEISANRPPGKRNMLSAMGRFELPPNVGYNTGTVAFTFARSPGKNHLENIKILQDSMPYFTTAIIDPTYDYPVCTTPMPVDSEEITPAASDRLLVFPNPAASAFTVKSEGKQIKRITLLNGFGKIALQSETTDISIQVGHLASGLYLIKAEMEDGSIEMGKVVVVR